MLLTWLSINTLFVASLPSCFCCPFLFYSVCLCTYLVSFNAGSYALRDLVGNLPCGQQHPAKNLEGDTVVSILNTIHEIITDSPENARALIQGHAVQKLVAINKSRYDTGMLKCLCKQSHF